MSMKNPLTPAEFGIVLYILNHNTRSKMLENENGELVIV